MMNISYVPLETTRATIVCLHIGCGVTASLDITGTRAEVEDVAQGWGGLTPPVGGWIDGYCPAHATPAQ